MGKKLIVFAVSMFALFGLLYLGATVHAHTQNTAERVAASILKDFAGGKTEPILNRLTVDARKDRDVYWQQYLKTYKPLQDAAAQISADRIVDTFHAYPTDGDPHRYLYKYTVDGKEYRLTLVLFKLQGQWVIDDLFGTYVQQS